MVRDETATVVERIADGDCDDGFDRVRCFAGGGQSACEASRVFAFKWSGVFDAGGLHGRRGER